MIQKWLLLINRFFTAEIKNVRTGDAWSRPFGLEPEPESAPGPLTSGAGAAQTVAAPQQWFIGAGAVIFRPALETEPILISRSRKPQTPFQTRFRLPCGLLGKHEFKSICEDNMLPKRFVTIINFCRAQNYFFTVWIRARRNRLEPPFHLELTQIGRSRPKRSSATLVLKLYSLQ